MSLPGILALIGVGIAGGVIAWLLWRGRNGWPSLPEWTWSDIRKAVALIGTIVGAAVLTTMAWGLLDELVIMAKGLIRDLLVSTPQAPPPKEIGAALEIIIAAIAWGLKLLLGGVVVVLLSLGFVITPRSFEFRGPGNIGGGFRGGDSDLPPPVQAARAVAEAADDKAEQIAANAGEPAKPAPKLDDPAIPDYAKP